MLSRFRPLSQAGDTIVEVMVVLAVLGLAIGISYATANRSLLADRGAQENSQATEILQGQLEHLRANAAISDPADTTHYIYRTSPTFFCFDVATGLVNAGFSGGSTPQTATYPAGCLYAANYDISISYVPAQDTFTATAIWDDVQGQGKDSVTLVYRVHQ